MYDEAAYYANWSLLKMLLEVWYTRPFVFYRLQVGLLDQPRPGSWIEAKNSGGGGIGPSAPSSPSPVLSVLRNRKNTNSI